MTGEAADIWLSCVRRRGELNADTQVNAYRAGPQAWRLVRLAHPYERVPFRISTLKPSRASPSGGLFQR